MSGQPIAFVAHEQIPPSPPPPSAVGPVKWMRENLFAGPVNTILTLVSVGFIIWLAIAAIPWFVDSSWSPEDMSLRGCRAEASGACFAVLVERFWQFIFGFYPSELYWRPTMAFVLLLVSLWPVLFSSAPRQLLILTAIYPALAFWLIWGGTFWGPAAVVAGFVVGALIMQRGGDFFKSLIGEAFAPLVTIIVGVLAIILWQMLLVVPIDEALSSILNIGLEPVESRLLGGFMLSLIIGFTGIAASLPIGIALALGRQSKLFIVKTISIGFIEFIRGVPLITLLFVASVLLNYFLPPGTDFDIILRVCIMVTLFSAAYMAEVVRGGIAALPKGQYEAGDAMGLTYWQTQQLIILPQALKIAIPNIVSSFIGLFKDTTLVIIIGLLDPLGLTTAIRADAAWNGIFTELYLFVALFFFIFCFGMSRYSMYLERKLATDHR